MRMVGGLEACGRVAAVALLAMGSIVPFDGPFLSATVPTPVADATDMCALTVGTATTDPTLAADASRAVAAGYAPTDCMPDATLLAAAEARAAIPLDTGTAGTAEGTATTAGTPATTTPTATPEVAPTTTAVPPIATPPTTAPASSAGATTSTDAGGTTTETAGGSTGGSDDGTTDSGGDGSGDSGDGSGDSGDGSGDSSDGSGDGSGESGDGSGDSGDGSGDSSDGSGDGSDDSGDGSGDSGDGSGTSGGPGGDAPGDDGSIGCKVDGTTDLAAGDGTITAAGKLCWGTAARTEDFDTDLSAWSVYDGPGHAGKGRRSPDAVSMSGGILTITGNSSGTTGGMSWGDGARYGRWEARVRSPVADPTYNAVMLLWPDADNWPVGGEVDFMEIGDETRREVDFFLHHGADNSQEHGSIDTVDAAEWHNWAVEWSPTAITAYVDGEPWYTTTDTSHFPPGPMHLTLQLDWFPKGNGAVQQSAMHVDWVRYYPVDGSGAGETIRNSLDTTSDTGTDFVDTRSGTSGNGGEVVEGPVNGGSDDEGDTVEPATDTVEPATDTVEPATDTVEPGTPADPHTATTVAGTGTSATAGGEADPDDATTTTTMVPSPAPVTVAAEPSTTTATTSTTRGSWKKRLRSTATGSTTTTSAAPDPES